jgi:hypothetical protein
MHLGYRVARLETLLERPSLAAAEAAMNLAAMVLSAVGALVVVIAEDDSFVLAGFFFAATMGLTFSVIMSMQSVLRAPGRTIARLTQAAKGHPDFEVGRAAGRVMSRID